MVYKWTEGTGLEALRKSSLCRAAVFRELWWTHYVHTINTCIWNPRKALPCL